MIIEILLIFIVAILVMGGIAISFMAKKLFKIINYFLPVGSSSIQEEGILKTWKYKFMLLKSYFDNGYSITSYPKWILATIGIGSAIQGYSLLWLLLGGIIYGVICLILGWIFIKYGFYLAQQEVSNQFNLFVKELRERK